MPGQCLQKGVSAYTKVGFRAPCHTTSEQRSFYENMVGFQDPSVVVRLEHFTIEFDCNMPLYIGVVFLKNTLFWAPLSPLEWPMVRSWPSKEGFTPRR